MAWNTKNIQKDANGVNIIPAQYYNPATDEYEVTQGSGGSILTNSTGNNQVVGQVYEFAWATGIANPTFTPTLSTSSTGGALAGATYFCVVSWVDSNGQTLVSNEASIVIPTTTTTNSLTVTIPQFPTGVTSANVFISTSSKTETLQGNTTTTQFVQTAALVNGQIMPYSNTTVQPQGTQQVNSIPIPSPTQKDATYLVTIENNGSLNCSVTAILQNLINYGSGQSYSTVCQLGCPNNSTVSYLVEGFLIGDGNSQIILSNDFPAPVSGGTAYVEVRKV